MKGHLPVAALLLALGAAAPAQAEGPPPTIHFATPDICVDQIGPAKGWRVRKAVEIWNAAGSATLTLRPHCDPTAPHVTVREVKRASRPHGWVAYVDGTWWEENTFIPTEVDIFLNRHHIDSPCQNLYITVHELGHALGLPHNESRWSPMSYVYEVEMRCGRLSGADVRAIQALYAGVSA